MSRPVIKIKPTKFDIALEVVAILVLVTLWGFVLVSVWFPTCLSSEVFHLEKWDVWDFVHPAIATCGVLVLLFIAYRPRAKDCVVKITEENAEQLYPLMSRFFRVSAIFFSSLFGWVSVKEHLISSDTNDRILTITILPVFVFWILYGIYYYIQSLKLR